MPDPSRVCDLHRSSGQRGILNPLSQARDGTCIFMDTSWVHSLLSHSGNCYALPFKGRYVKGFVDIIFSFFFFKGGEAKGKKAQSNGNEREPWVGSWISLLGLHNRTPQTGWLKQQKCIFGQFRRLEVQDQGAGKVAFRWGLSPSLTDGHLLAVPLPGFPLGAHS